MLGLSRIPTTQAQTTILAALAGVPNAAGSGAGASVTVPITFTDQFGSGLLPGGGYAQSYAVLVTASQPCTYTASAKTAEGFTVTLTPLTSGVTLAAGTIDVLVVG